MDLNNGREAAAVPPMAGGQPIGEDTAEQAAQWLTLLMSGEASEADRRRLQLWLRADPEHERAWRHIEAVTGRLKLLAPKAAYQVLSHTQAQTSTARRPSRRQALRLLGVAGLAGGASLLASRTQAWQEAAADYRCATGEQRSLTLDDGTLITLNTGSAVDVRFTDQQRRLRLVAGEIMVSTGHALRQGLPDARPFFVDTAQGSIRALGTRFMVRQWAQHSSVAVLESAVEITPTQAGPALRLRAGERSSFTRQAAAPAQALDETAEAWTRGQLVADDMRLADFLTELARYRSGLLRCEAAVADLRLSGVFPLGDTEHILASLPAVLPVRLRQLSRYWVTVAATEKS
jgi:transmembrane sensor